MATNETGDLVLVTGASGYIAGHCVRELLEDGYRVRGTVRSLADPRQTEHLGRMATALHGSLELVEADLSSDAGWLQAVAGCVYVLHVASPFPAEIPKNEMDLIGRRSMAPGASGSLRRRRNRQARGDDVVGGSRRVRTHRRP